LVAAGRLIGMLGQLAAVFAGLSLMAIGGANALVPEMQRQVAAQGWMTPAEFASLFALAQAAPGPNMLVVTLVGWRVAGLAGAATATAAFVVPAGLLTYGIGRLWHRFRDAPWRRAAQNGLTAVTVGLVLAAAAFLLRSTVHGLGTAFVASGVTLLALTTRVHPLWLLGAAAGLGAAGVV
jgi:chromate transporter